MPQGKWGLRGAAKTSLQVRLDGVVPFGQSFMARQSKRGNLIGHRFEAARIVPAVEIGSEPQSGLGLGGAGIVADLLGRIQSFACPVACDFKEEAMFEGTAL